MPATADKGVAIRSRSVPGRDDYFYLLTGLLVAAVIVYGFGQTIGADLIHAIPAKPFLLYVHAVAFSAWILFYLLQSALVRARKVRLHRTLGWFGAAIGTSVFVLGIWTAIVMGRFHGAEAFAPVLFLSFSDTTAFAVLFALGICFRAKPEAHRRLLFLATCVLTSAGFGRFPIQWLADHWFYAGVDCLVLTGIAHDILTRHRVHPVYRLAVPSLVSLQLFGAYVSFTPDPTWIRIAHRILS